MASFGVGDAISIAEKIVQMYKVYAGAQAEMDEAVMEVRSLQKDRLDYLGKKVGDQSTFISTYGKELASWLKENLKALKSDLKELAKHIQKWTRIMDLCKSNWLQGHWMKAAFIAKDLGKVNDVYQKLRKHDKRIGKIVQNLQLEQGSEISELVKTLKEQGKQDAKANRNNAKQLKQWRELLEKNGVAKVTEVACSSNDDLWEKLKKNLIEKGMTRADADLLMDPIYANLQKLECPPAVETGPKAKTDNIRIMCVDMRNEARSILTQTYLELLRVWTANTTGQWLFREVESAGCLVDSQLTRKHKSELKEILSPSATHTNDIALTALSGQKHFRSFEKDDIFSRLSLRSTIGISKWHFQHWDYFLCADKATFDLLERLKSYAKGDELEKRQVAKIIPPMNIDLHEDLQMTLSAMKITIKAWLNSEFGWAVPDIPIKNGPRRTKQRVIPEQSFNTLLAKGQAKRKEIAAESSCEIRLTYRHQHMVSVIGPKKALSNAEELLRKC